MARKKEKEVETYNNSSDLILNTNEDEQSKVKENRNQVLQEALEKISKKYEIVLRSAEFLDVKRIRTGIFAIDWATGGGIPAGKVTVFWGDWSSSKTTVALRVAANVIKSKGYVFWIDAESSFNSYWAGVIGVDVKSDRIYVAQPRFCRRHGFKSCY